MPKVAAYESSNKGLTIDTFDSEGKSYQLPLKRDPDELVLVVKDNERIEVISNGQGVQSLEWDYFMTDGANRYFFSSPNFNHAKIAMRKHLRKMGIGTDFNVGPNSPEYRSHSFRPEAPRAYAYYKTYYRDGSLRTNTAEPFAGTMDHTVKDRICFIRFTSMSKVNLINEGWPDGDLEFIGRALTGGRTSAAFTSVEFGSASVPRFAAALTVPGFADAVEGGYGEVCIPKFPFGCKKENPLLDAFNELRSADRLFDNRGSAVNNGVWINWNNGTQLINWDAEEYGNRIMLVVKEKDDGATYTQEYSYSVGVTATFGKKDGSNISFTESASGKTTVTWRNDDDALFEQIIDYSDQYGAFKRPVNAGDTEFILRTY